jgi:hypothetical protein
MLPGLIESFERIRTYKRCRVLLAGRIDAVADP